MGKSTEPKLFDVTILGAGPTGMFGAFYAGMREMSCKLIDALPQAGGQITALYPEKKIFDTPGFPTVVGKELVENLFEQASQWDTKFALGERAETLRRVPAPAGEPDEECWVIGTTKGDHYSRAVIIAAGIGAFRPVKLPNEDVNRFEGKGLDYFVRDIEKFADKRVLIVGGGDSAVDWALAADPIAEHVTLIHRRPGFRAHDTSVNKLDQSGVEVRIRHELRELQGDGQVERAVIFDNQTDEETTIDVDAVILALGFKADLGPIRTWGLETIGRRYVRVNNKMETNLPKVYAAGDLALQEGLEPLNLIVVGYGQVTVAVNYAYVAIKPGEKVFPGHSSEKMADR
ncbi:MAG: NAD(P)/FAD-dependent oxidoreductase [Chloroflexi bacterium]|nr:NAD(P)/FAD-dependent oxidoreductase [Chloroflexota bacterium]MDK1045047.1 NAD(P)/FAD-dependent oxidoreductase [Anaerolineales bacterium]MCI0805335.1 NAD(P)/FAD-dependent oxidoreductase [Chloroflexota bacterium]MCI0827071.1 NAD(P)/FAD-dependent oxidoreductase [Chloroflexota bacterium]MCI0853889.1 NAD(P)/FAD-dependent oxidoreductase [Chloroflexota bacterium]